jgi:hypothetical protein
VRKYDVQVAASVTIEVNDDSAILRCVENHNEHGVPVPYGTGQRGWRDVLYNLDTEDKVIDMWVSNALRNGIENASQLDGWADMSPSDVRMTVDYVEVDGFTEETDDGAGPLLPPVNP